MELEEWKSRYRRAMGMSSKELANRLRQQATARLDFLRYKVGIEFEPRLDGSTSARPAPHFFFSTDDIPRLCSRLRELFPEQTERIIAQAERICKHRFDLLGYRELDYGMEIDWHCDRVHAKRASRKPWFQIRYLDFEEVGDSKVTWELNRHQHLVTLAKAFQITGDASFANELFRQWKHWHRENPYPIGINWASSLEVAFRSISWLWVYFLMSGSAVTPAEFHGEVVRSLSVSGRHIVSGVAEGQALARPGMEGSAGGCRASGSRGRTSFRAIDLLSRLRAGLFSSLQRAGLKKRNHHPRQF